jgi:CHAT domain-containing protein
VPLCSEDDLEKIMSEKALYESGRDFYDLLWAPLEPSLQGVDIVYYAADGLLNQIPFHSIILSRKGEPITYAMDRYELHKLTSTRYLALELKAAAQQPPAHSIAMLGGMDYDYLPGQSKSRRKGSGNKAKERSSQYSGQPLMYLEGTMKEVQESAKQLKRQKTEYDVTTYTGVEAKEELLYEIDSIGVPGILHIATHGYAFPEMDFSDTTISEHSLRYVYRYSPYPMVRSGLIMTSGNWKWTGSDTLKTINPANEDGILTAMEVADLPLDECKLVVLSACESALGHIDEEEGTLGIVRGFKLAGVEQIMATLWSINDKKASEFMLAYYEHLAHNNNTIKAYQETQLLMRNKYPTNPQYWAGFVLMR